MSHFFQPNSKVQKDRHIMRETDARMAKYSRRGLIFNFIAFLVCLLGGEFVNQNRELSFALASGLLLATILRGYYLFRFDQHYPRGPARWRNVYFVVTLIGAVWWGIILASITLVLGLKDEASLLWLYTIVFFSTTAHAFAPYHRFLTYYQFFGLVPAAAAAIFIGGLDGYLYGALMLMFYLILSHQCRLISDNYWEKLEAGYALSKRASRDNQDQLNDHSGQSLNREFLRNLEIRVSDLFENSDRSASSELAVLLDNVRLFKDVQCKSLKTVDRVFNIRHELQSIASEFVEHAEEQNIHLETLLSTNLPMRLKGDPVRLGQIIRTMLRETLLSNLSSTLIIEAQFLREFEAAGELHITLKHDKNKSSSIPFFTGVDESEEPQSLELSIAKGMAELFGGELEVVKTAENSYEVHFNCRLDIVDKSGHQDFHKDRFHGSRILLVSNSVSLAAIKRNELEALGFIASIETQYKRVGSMLCQQIKTGQTVENVLIYHDATSEACSKLLAFLRDSDELKSINKIIAASETSQKELSELGLQRENGFYFISKPLGLFELESTFDYIFSLKGDEASLNLCKKGTVIIVGDGEAVDSVALNSELLPLQKIIKCKQSELSDLLETAYNIMVVLPCRPDLDPMNALEVVREFEARHTANDIFIPVIGVGHENCGSRDIAAFEIGFDDFIDMGSSRAAALTSTLRYWRTIAQ